MFGQPMEKKTFHFNLTYAQAYGSAENRVYTLHTGDADYELRPHTDETRAAFRQRNRALALLSDEQLAGISHYAEEVEVPSDVARFLRLTFPEPGAPLPALASLITYIPAEARAANRRTNVNRLRRRQHSLLRHYGVELENRAKGTSDNDLLALWSDADLVADSPLEVAKSLAFSHPQMATRNAETAAVVMDDHIDTTNDLLAFATLISKLGPATEQGGWAKINPSIDQYGQPLKWGPGYESEDHPEGSTVYYYDLNNEIAGTDTTPPGDSSGLSVVNQSLQTSQDDTRLENQSWSVFQGTPDQRQSSDLTARRAARFAASAEAGEFSFTLNNRTPGFGLEVPKDSIEFTPDGTNPLKGQFEIDAKNGFLRTLSAYVQFYDSQGKAIDNPPGWDERLPEFLRKIFESPSKKYIKSVTAVNVILGIPMPTDPEILNFPWPAEATSCELLFGGIGTRNWDGTVDPMGILLTGIFQYGVPMLFMLGGAALTSTAWFKDFVSKTDNIVAALGVAFPIVGGGVATAAALANTKKVLFSFAGAIAGILIGKGLEKLAAYIIAKLTAAQIANAIPIVGFAFRIAQMAITFANLAVTTVEVAISPATYDVQVRRQLALRLTMHPDPLHGTATQKPVWPKVATQYITTVQYRNGTNYTVTGSLPTNPSQRDQPVVINFPDLPGGGQFQVVFGVYSDNHWLAGNWASAWVDAVAPSGSGGVLTMEGQIQELLVPLDANTQYLYDTKLVYDAGQQEHVWHKGDQPTAVVSDLNGGSVGHNLSQLVNITLNDKAYMLGYTWQASGQNLPLCGSTDPVEGQIYAFQNISTLARPESALKFPSCGFSGQPYLVYDQFGPASLFSLDSSFQSGLDQGQVTPALKAAFAANAYALPDNATNKVAKPTVQWLISTGLPDPTYDLRREPNGRISVYSYPTPAFSPNNFYVDPRTGIYHLRKVVLDEKTPFDMNPGLSYGYFTEAHLDSIVVHPAGYVVGVNFKNNKMEIIPIPEEGKPDAEAQPASMVSGLGIRQGLLNGPRAIAVTADGRLLVLEESNRRIQAFDLNGNPVASFDGDAITQLKADTYAPDLDQELATMALREAFATAGVNLSAHWTITDTPDQYDVQLNEAGLLNLQRNGADLSSQWLIEDQNGSYPVLAAGDHLEVQVQPPFNLPFDYSFLLDRGGVTEEIVADFATHGITLSPQALVTGNGLQVPGTYQVDLARGIISADLKAAYATRGATITDNAVLNSRVLVRAQAAGGLWIVDDTDATQSYRISRDTSDTTKLGVVYYNPSMNLYVPTPDEIVTYLDLGVELQGFIYVLSYTGDGKAVENYKLDLYDPTGKWLSRTPDKAKDPKATGVNGARLIVDMWRSMYTLNFEHFEGPGGRTEPSVSTWLPTTPK